MRISTSQIFDSGSRNIMNGQSAVYKTQNQMSTGRRFLTPQDDPVAASQVLLDTQARQVAAQYGDNQSNALSQLSLEESRLQSIVDTVQYIQEQVVAGGNASYSDSQREFIANDLKSQFDTLLGLANSADASGHYLFSGFQGEAQPFELTSTGAVNYVGDDGQRLLQVGSSRQIAVSDSGRDIFNNNRTGNGTFTTAAAAANTGTGIVTTGSVVNPQAVTGNNYQLQFNAGGTYTVTNTTTAAVLGTFPYATGAAITAIPGTSFSISGTPATGDTFTLKPSANQSMFATLKDLIGAFSTDIAGNAVAGASVRNTINAGMSNLDQVLDNVARVQASIGSRMHELQGLADISSNLDIQYQEKISKLQDLDYVEAASRLSNQQIQLEAAQKSFTKISGLSLFNFL
jgi:flagellar hook-associated protein 3 FlgL